MTVKQNDPTVRPISGREELDLFSRFPYVLNDEVADDLTAGRLVGSARGRHAQPPGHPRYR
ncbi:hypothetical protein [Streptomyces sp. NPDC058268]|uniref:hypothetical protein n=1 Tax=Streptomyces sp. NPDC058268 TaxID=3346413 RepID=UPI0036E017E7